MKPLAIDLFCGLGGWAEGFLSEGYEVVGFDIEAHDYGTGYPGKLVLRDVRSIHGSELKDAAVIVASPPCQAYSYRAMPWKRAKALPPPDNELFNECFRIQREASEAAGHYIPLIVENVRGAQKWVGAARWHYGSYYLWGDVPALMPMASSIKNGGGSWFAIGSPGQKITGQNPDGRKVSMNFHEHAKTGKPGRSFQSCAVEGVKQHGSGAAWWDKALDERRRQATAVKVGKINLSEIGFNVAATKLLDRSTLDGSKISAEARAEMRKSHLGTSRKAASAMIAKIPFPLASHIARCFKPAESAAKPNYSPWASMAGEVVEEMDKSFSPIASADDEALA